MLAAFWANADRSGGADSCWLWRGCELDEYARWHGELAHRVAYELEYQEPLPPHVFVLHRCDTPPCINPLHLFVGTALDNVRDMYRKDRGRFAASAALAHALRPREPLPLFAALAQPKRFGRPPATHIGVCVVCGRRVRVRDGVSAQHGWSLRETLPLFGPNCAGSARAPKDLRVLRAQR